MLTPYYIGCPTFPPAHRPGSAPCDLWGRRRERPRDRAEPRTVNPTNRRSVGPTTLSVRNTNTANHRAAHLMRSGLCRRRNQCPVVCWFIYPIYPSPGPEPSQTACSQTPLSELSTHAPRPRVREQLCPQTGLPSERFRQGASSPAVCNSSPQRGSVAKLTATQEVFRTRLLSAPKLRNRPWETSSATH